MERFFLNQWIQQKDKEEKTSKCKNDSVLDARLIQEEKEFLRFLNYLQIGDKGSVNIKKQIPPIFGYCYILEQG